MMATDSFDKKIVITNSKIIRKLKQRKSKKTIKTQNLLSEIVNEQNGDSSLIETIFNKYQIDQIVLLL